MLDACQGVYLEHFMGQFLCSSGPLSQFNMLYFNLLKLVVCIGILLLSSCCNQPRSPYKVANHCLLVETALDMSPFSS